MLTHEYYEDPSTVRLHFLGGKAVCPFCSGQIVHPDASDICICYDCNSVFLLLEGVGSADRDMAAKVLKRKGEIQK